MGTSGSGKSTVGSALSTALNCPFVDGDDLHPPSNVAKMSSGHPLNDSDREPWLLRIRRFGLELATTQRKPDLPSQSGEQRKLAEVYETSHQPLTSTDHVAASTSSSATPSTTTSQPQSEAEASKGKVAIIACSSLKLVYRRLLRGTIDSLSDPRATEPEGEQPTDLRVVHVYLDLSRELLEERMKGRKGHFMKLDMLYSQLDTLQKPEEGKEPGVVVVEVKRETGTVEIVEGTVKRLREMGVV